MVSSLNPLELALVRDDSTMFEKRAYPLMEFMLSREKFLFSLDSTQKIQSPSRKLKGPIAPFSELLALYNVFGRKSISTSDWRKRGIQQQPVCAIWIIKKKGRTGSMICWLYKATGDKKYLKTAITGADQIHCAKDRSATNRFQRSHAGRLFLLAHFTGRWIEFLELYELTGNEIPASSTHRRPQLYHVHLDGACYTR